MESFSRVSSRIVGALLVALVGAPQFARAQCTPNPTNGGVLQNGGAPCTVANNVTVGFGTAISAANSADVTANGAVTAHGFGTGISATGNSTVVVNGPVTASGAGLSASSGSTIIANGILLGNDGGGGAIAMIANNATIIANGITVNWPNGGGQSLVQALAGGLVQFTPGSSITIPGGGAPSTLLADGVGSRIIADGLSLSMGGSGGIIAAKAQAGGNIQLTGGDITFSGGGGNTGLSATGANSSITATGVNILVGTGGSDVDANADSGGHVTLTGGSVSVQGGGGGETGLRATGAGSLITANDVAVSVTGSGGDAGVNAANGAAIMTTGGSVSVVNGAGGLLQNGGSVAMAGTNVTASGNGGFGFLFNNGGSANTLQYSNGTITASNASFSVEGATASIGLINTIATANNNTLLDTNSSGNTIFDAQGSTLQGVISTTNSISTVTLQQNTVWTMTGNSTATTLTNDNSQIIYTAPTADPTQLSSYKTLTVRSYIGNSGTIGLNTFLGTDGSPSDRLIINGGSATGYSLLRITNAGGPGAETVANGIAVVQAINGGTTVPGAFALVGEVRAGAFDYRLFRGGLAGSSPNDWFLRSSFIVPPEPPEPPVPPVPPVPPIVPPEPPPEPLPPGVYPIIGPEIATYGVVQPIARQLGMTTLGTLHDRIGDTLLDANMSARCQPDVDTRDGILRKVKALPDCLDAGWRPSTWGRIIGQQIDNHYKAFADPRASGQLLGFQAGIDLWRAEPIAGHRDAAGLYVGYANANVDVKGLVTNDTDTGYVLRHTGGLNLDAWSGGAYWTHYGPYDWYLDAALQATRYDGSAATQFAKLDTTGTGLLASLEGGYPIALPALGPGFVLEPQAQIVWQRVQFDPGSDQFGDVAVGTSTGTSGRIGVRARWSIVAEGHVWQPYLRANLWQDWGGNTAVVYSGLDSVPLLERATRLQLGGGLNVRMDTNLSFYANADYQFSVGNSDGGRRDGIRGAAGVRYTW